MIAIANYGLGNIKAFANIFTALNVPFSVVTDSEGLKAADKIILPGVGAFDYAMQLLKASGMAETLNECVVEQEKPVLGICVGMQMLANSSEEGSEPGLGWIAGSVKRIRFPEAGGQKLLPHMGWNTLNGVTEHPLLKGFDKQVGFYFLHSYSFHCASDQASIATVNYGSEFTCAVNNRNIYGVQFHPEKSHHNGIRLLKNFSEI